ncbi:hypothetical protein G7Y89_g13132 [Cudoniella acicularis]|uniref:Uncharacterized protein n=1 Tax=Cudoniella acicularis TaxID=354080 RepID=A0A8H4R9W7_9HELO|nr:hypothetical protein G7Y89_g13132 [Cudoniella acicularis]
MDPEIGAPKSIFTAQASTGFIVGSSVTNFELDGFEIYGSKFETEYREARIHLLDGTKYPGIKPFADVLEGIRIALERPTKNENEDPKLQHINALDCQQICLAIQKSQNIPIMSGIALYSRTWEVQDAYRKCICTYGAGAGKKRVPVYSALSCSDDMSLIKIKFGELKEKKTAEGGDE